MSALQPLSDDELVSEIRIAAPPARVFQALIDPAQVVLWWGQKGIYRCTKFETDLRVGGAWRCSGLDARGRQFEIHGVYSAVAAPQLLETSWVATWTGDMKSTVRWELEPAGGGTLVRIRHGAFQGRSETSRAYSGWPRMLGWIQALIEKGETVDQRPEVTRS
jgi:uncharacterized protein YndB with AHSA1/START domain